MQDTKSVTVTIEDGIVQCNPASAYVHKGQTLTWICKEGFPFAIHLGYDSPFDEVHLQAHGKDGINLFTNNGTPCGRYKYVVAISDGRNVWIEDPEFIIRR